jgi:hypothetical protein
MDRISPIIYRNIYDYIYPVNNMSILDLDDATSIRDAHGISGSSLDRDDAHYISEYRIISKYFKYTINRLYNFDKNYIILEPYFKQVSYDRHNAFEISHRFDLLIDLTHKALEQGKQNLVKQRERWSEMVYKIRNHTHCKFCDVLIHKETDYCDYCHTRLYINCIMCTLRVYQIHKNENNKLCTCCRNTYY